MLWYSFEAPRRGVALLMSTHNMCVFVCFFFCFCFFVVVFFFFFFLLLLLLFLFLFLFLFVFFCLFFYGWFLRGFFCGEIRKKVFI